MSTEELLAIAGGLALLILPGALVLAALGEDDALDIEELPATWFALTLAVLAVPATVAALVPIRLEFVFWWLGAVSLVAGGAAAVRLNKQALSARLAAAASRHEPLTPDAEEPPAPRSLVASTIPRGVAVAAAIATLLLTAGAYAFTRGGSVDRWWYLAFVRGFLVDGQLSTIDPLLGSGTSIARFACNAWLATLAVWARMTSADPVVLYERAAPLILAPLALSATASAVRSLLRDRAAALASIVIAAVYWCSGGPFPALTRLPEDKILAILILVPVLWAAVQRVVAQPQLILGPLATAGLAALALATVHPLVFVVGLVTVTPALLVARRRVAIALAVTIAFVAIIPVSVGLGAREQVAQAASVVAEEHPVGRIHASRERIESVDGALRVEPRLLADPISIVALLALPFLVFRGGRERALLVIPSVAALALCFVPPLTTLLARAVTPWMTYRFLWAIPFVPLVVSVVRGGARHMPYGYVIPLGCIVVLGLPGMFAAYDVHTRTPREALATPSSNEFRALVARLRALPPASVVAAAPELAERIPGLSGRHVLAASDRATVVFGGSLAKAESRLRDRAALLAGVYRQSEATPAPTHVLFAPGAPATRYCAEVLFTSERFVLCSFRAAEPPAGMKLPPLPGEAPVGRELDLAAGGGADYRVECTPRRDPTSELIAYPRPGAWSAEAPGVRCELATIARDGLAEHTPLLHPRALVLEVVTGRAVEEITVLVRGEREGRQRWNLRTRQTVRHGEHLRYALPAGGVDRMQIALVPSRLPFVKLSAFRLALDDSQSPVP